MPRIALLSTTWLVVFLVAGLLTLWMVGGAAPLPTIAWAVVLAAAALLASATTMMLAAGRWRRAAATDRATAPTPASRRELRLGNGYLILAAALAVVAVMLVLVYRLAYTV